MMQRNDGPRSLENRRKSAVAPGKSFEFITFNDPKHTRKADTRRLVRKHAMRDVLERSRTMAMTSTLPKPEIIPPHVKGLPILAPRPSQSDKSASSNGHRRPHHPQSRGEAAPEDHSHDETAYPTASAPGPMTILGAGRVDPFARYPSVEMDPHLNGVVDYYHTGYHQFKLPRDVWFVLGLADPAAFYQLLSTSAAVRARMRKDEEDALALRYRLKAIKSVNERLSDPKQVLAEGIVAAIMAFLCYDYKLDHFDSWKKDIRGLQNIIRLRGGVQTLNGNAVLRVLLTWTDLMGSSALDKAPHFPFPVEIIPSTVAKSSKWDPQGIQSSNLSKLNQPHLSSICQSLSNLVISIRERFGSYKIQLDQMFFAVEVNSVFYHLLHIPHIDEPTNLGELMQETYRLASIIYTGKFFEYANVGPWYHDRHARKIKLRLSQCDIDWHQFDVMKLWVLSLGALGIEEEMERSWYCDEIGRLCHDMKLRSWPAVSQILFRLPWMHGVFRLVLMELFVDILN